MAATYGGKFHSIDSTFNTTKHDLKLFLTTVVDCLGKNAPVGASLIDVEGHDQVVASCRALGLDSPNANVGCDRGLGISAALETLGQHRVIDSWHYVRNAHDASENLCDYNEYFLSDFHRAVYHNFVLTEACDDHLREMINKYTSTSTIRNFCERLWEERVEACKTYYMSCACFVFGKGSHIRSEKSIARLKGMGEMKDNMRIWTLYKCLNNYEYYLITYEFQAKKELKELVVSESGFVSKKIQKHTYDAMQMIPDLFLVGHSMEYYHLERKLGGLQQKVQTKGGLHVYEVFAPFDRNSHPPCT